MGLDLDALSCQIKSSSQSPLLARCQGLQIYQGITTVLLCWGHPGTMGGTGNKGWRVVDQKLLQGFPSSSSPCSSSATSWRRGSTQLWDLQRAKLLVLRGICDLENPAAASILRHLWEGMQGAAPSPTPHSCLCLVASGEGSRAPSAGAQLLLVQGKRLLSAAGSSRCCCLPAPRLRRAPLLGCG